MKVWDRRRKPRGWHENAITRELQSIALSATIECREALVKHIKVRDYKVWGFAFVVGVVAGVVGMVLGNV